MIVWIDDDTNIIDDVVLRLERAGHRIIRYNTIQDALDHISELKEAEAILLDMIIPPGTNDREFGPYPGKDFLGIIRNEYKLTTPVVVFSVVTAQSILDELKELGVSDVVRKGIRPTELKERVEKAINSHTAIQNHSYSG